MKGGRKRKKSNVTKVLRKLSSNNNKNNDKSRDRSKSATKVSNIGDSDLGSNNKNDGAPKNKEGKSRGRGLSNLFNKGASKDQKKRKNTSEVQHESNDNCNSNISNEPVLKIKQNIDLQKIKLQNEMLDLLNDKNNKGEIGELLYELYAGSHFNMYSEFATKISEKLKDPLDISKIISNKDSSSFMIWLARGGDIYKSVDKEGASYKSILHLIAEQKPESFQEAAELLNIAKVIIQQAKIDGNLLFLDKCDKEGRNAARVLLDRCIKKVSHKGKENREFEQIKLGYSKGLWKLFIDNGCELSIPPITSILHQSKTKLSLGTIVSGAVAIYFAVDRLANLKRGLKFVSGTSLSLASSIIPLMTGAGIFNFGDIAFTKIFSVVKNKVSNTRNDNKTEDNPPPLGGKLLSDVIVSFTKGESKRIEDYKKFKSDTLPIQSDIKERYDKLKKYEDELRKAKILWIESCEKYENDPSNDNDNEYHAAKGNYNKASNEYGEALLNYNNSLVDLVGVDVNLIGSCFHGESVVGIQKHEESIKKYCENTVGYFKGPITSLNDLNLSEWERIKHARNLIHKALKLEEEIKYVWVNDNLPKPVDIQGKLKKIKSQYDVYIRIQDDNNCYCSSLKDKDLDKIASTILEGGLLGAFENCYKAVNAKPHYLFFDDVMKINKILQNIERLEKERKKKIEELQKTSSEESVQKNNISQDKSEKAQDITSDAIKNILDSVTNYINEKVASLENNKVTEKNNAKAKKNKLKKFFKSIADDISDNITSVGKNLKNTSKGRVERLWINYFPEKAMTVAMIKGSGIGLRSIANATSSFYNIFRRIYVLIRYNYTEFIKICCSRLLIAAPLFEFSYKKEVHYEDSRFCWPQDEVSRDIDGALETQQNLNDNDKQALKDLLNNSWGVKQLYKSEIINPFDILLNKYLKLNKSPEDLKKYLCDTDTSKERFTNFLHDIAHYIIALEEKMRSKALDESIDDLEIQRDSLAYFIIEVLKEKKDLLFAKDINGNSIFHTACANGSDCLVEKIIGFTEGKEDFLNLIKYKNFKDQTGLLLTEACDSVQTKDNRYDKCLEAILEKLFSFGKDVITKGGLISSDINNLLKIAMKYEGVNIEIEEQDKKKYERKQEKKITIEEQDNHTILYLYCFLKKNECLDLIKGTQYMKRYLFGKDKFNSEISDEEFYATLEKKDEEDSKGSKRGGKRWFFFKKFYKNT